MASEVEIANRALTKLGSARIIALTDSVKAARTMNSMFNTVRDAELRAHPWNFSITRVALPALADAPAWGFARQFQLPSDSLRVMQVGETWLQWNGFSPVGIPSEIFQIEASRILTDLSAPLNVRYVKREEDPQQFDALFVEALAARLALEAAEDLTQSAGKIDRIERMYRAAIREARRTDAIENPPSPQLESAWLEARH